MKYEVIKLTTGSEICGIVEDLKTCIRITAPMICHLTKVDTINTLATFIPYTPLSSESQLSIAHKHIMHRGNMSEQYIPFYDEASSKWLTLVETKTIPITNKMTKDEYIRKTLDGLVSTFTDEELDAYERGDYDDDDITDADIKLYEEAIKDKIIH